MVIKPKKRKIIWEQEVETLHNLAKSKSIVDIAEIYGVSTQRLYQVFTQFGIGTPKKSLRNFLRDQSAEVYWLNRYLNRLQIPTKTKETFLKQIELPKLCPILGTTLIYYDQEWYKPIHNKASLYRKVKRAVLKPEDFLVISKKAHKLILLASLEELQAVCNFLRK